MHDLLTEVTYSFIITSGGTWEGPLAHQ